MKKCMRLPTRAILRFCKFLDFQAAWVVRTACEFQLQRRLNYYSCHSVIMGSMIKSNVLDNIRCCLSSSTGFTGLRQNECHNKPVKSKSLSENKNQNHSHEKFFLLRVGANTGISHNTDGHSSGQSRQPTS
mmetsp:Transcript_16482/g.23042  ORF Transcript_16482/g.23042 Transcript_16482/m.23042 type:complete len:131 (-) Transcript_16482:374-766(-)